MFMSEIFLDGFLVLVLTVSRRGAEDMTEISNQELEEERLIVFGSVYY